MKAALIVACTLCVSVVVALGQSTAKPLKINERQLSLASVFLQPYEGDTVLITKDLRKDLANFVASLPEPERLLIIASTSFEGTRASSTNTMDRINGPKGHPIGMIMMWMAEMHRARMIFDGFKITFHFLGTPLKTDSRWYSLGPELVDAFFETPEEQRTSKRVTFEYAQSVIKQNQTDLIQGLKVSAVNEDAGKIQLTGPISSLDALDRWLSIKFMKMAGENLSRRRMPFPAGKN